MGISSGFELFKVSFFLSRVRSGGAEVLGELSVPGVLLIRIIVGQGLIALAVGADGGYLDISLSSFLFSFSLTRRRPDID